MPKNWEKTDPKGRNANTQLPARLDLTPLPDLNVCSGRLRDPLLLDEIVEIVIAVLDIASILKCRLVCQVWNVEACRRLRKEVMIYISEDTLNSFCLTMSASTIQPFSRFSLETEELDMDLASIQLFLSYCKAATSAEISEVFMRSLSHPKLKHFQDILTYAPNLKKLHLPLPPHNLPPIVDAAHSFERLQSLCMNDQELQPASCDYFLDVISKAKSLHSLHISDPVLLHRLLCEGKLSRINYLRTYKLTMKHMEAFISKPRYVEGLNISQYDADCTGDMIGSLLSHISKSLLCLRVDQFTARGLIPLPGMENLKYISIDSWKGKITDFTLQQYPKLETINLNCLHSINWVSTQEPLDPNTSVREIIIEGTRKPNWNTEDYQEWLNQISLIHSQFPNFVSLEFHGVKNDYLFFTIYNHFPQLESLKFEWNKRLTDFAFTGIPLTKSNQELERYRNPDLFCKKAKNQILSSITKLKNLKKLHFDRKTCYRLKEPHKLHDLTNKTITHGIIYLSLLTDLKLCWIDKLFLRPIADNMPQLAHLVLTGNQCLCPCDLDYLKKKIPNLSLEFLSCHCLLEKHDCECGTTLTDGFTSHGIIGSLSNLMSMMGPRNAVTREYFRTESPGQSKSIDPDIECRSHPEHHCERCQLKSPYGKESMYANYIKSSSFPSEELVDGIKRSKNNVYPIPKPPIKSRVYTPSYETFTKKYSMANHFIASYSSPSVHSKHRRSYEL